MKRCVLFIGAVLALLSTAVPAQVGGVDVELNKLQQVDDACRAYLVTQNLTDTDFKSMQLDIVMFDDDGIAAKRLAVEIGPLAADKTSLKVFDIGGLPCENIGQLLLNNVLQCQDSEGKRDDCLALIHVSSRGKVAFIN